MHNSYVVKLTRGPFHTLGNPQGASIMGNDVRGHLTSVRSTGSDKKRFQVCSKSDNPIRLQMVLQLVALAEEKNVEIGIVLGIKWVNNLA